MYVCTVCDVRQCCEQSVQVLLDKLALDREKHTLEEENRKLKALLKQYLDGEWTWVMRFVVRWSTALAWY